MGLAFCNPHPDVKLSVLLLPAPDLAWLSPASLGRNVFKFCLLGLGAEEEITSSGVEMYSTVNKMVFEIQGGKFILLSMFSIRLRAAWALPWWD